MWFALSALAAVVVVGVIAVIMVRHAGPILKARITDTLSARFNSRVDLDSVDVFVLRGLEVSGDRLRIYPPDSPTAQGSAQPLISLEHFSFHAGVLGLLVKPMHVGAIRVTGLQINIPPRGKTREASRKYKGKIEILVDDIICDDSRLIIETDKPDKDPKVFELKHIELHDVGPSAPWRYTASLTNAIPRGEIHATGTFGPWQTDRPGDSSVTGKYTFEHADLDTIRGLGGILSSVGDFKGQLNRIAVQGTTDTPDFSLDTSGHPLPLHTQFQALVDGTSGDTYLQSVKATLRDSSFSTSGKVIDIKGRGHTIDLDVDVPQGRLQDFLDLAVKTEPPVMTAWITTKAKLHIRNGKERVVQKLSIQGNFRLARIHFTNPQVQDKVDMLSLRAQGEPKKARPGAEDVDSRMKGTFSLNAGAIRFSNLNYILPGAQVNLEGVYSMDGELFDFSGHVLTDASLSHMVDARWASILLKAASPFFRRKGGGAQIPVRISGTRSAPKFGLDVMRSHSRDMQAAR